MNGFSFLSDFFLLLGIHDTSMSHKVSTKDENFVCIWDACLKCLCQILDPFFKIQYVGNLQQTLKNSYGKYLLSPFYAKILVTKVTATNTLINKTEAEFNIEAPFLGLLVVFLVGLGVEVVQLCHWWLLGFVVDDGMQGVVRLVDLVVLVVRFVTGLLVVFLVVFIVGLLVVFFLVVRAAGFLVVFFAGL